MIYIPSSIWEEEVEIRNKARHRMLAISDAQEFYKELTGTYTMDGEHMFQLVEAATDSLIADSLFLGSRIIKLNLENYPVNMNEGFEVRVDTTFSESQNIKITYLDTTYTVLKNSKTSDGDMIDTSFVNGKRELKREKSKFNFITVIDTLESTKTKLETDYLRLKYHLADSLLYCPITKEKYFFHIINKEIIIDDDVNYVVKGTIISEDDNHIVFQTQSKDINLDNSQIKDNVESLDDSNLQLRNILISLTSENYKADLLGRMERSKTLSAIDKHGMIILRLDKNKIIKSADIEESIFSVETPLSEDYKESRFIIFSFESGDHGRIIDGSTSWSEQ